MTTQRKSSRIWDRWLLVVLVIVTGYALLLVLRGSWPGVLFERLGFGMAAAGIDGGPARDYVLFIYGVLGAVIVGWMVLLTAVALGPLRRREPWAVAAVAASLSTWFVVDTGFSLAVGSTGHALFNVGFVVAMGLPVAAMRRGSVVGGGQQPRDAVDVGELVARLPQVGEAAIGGDQDGVRGHRGGGEDGVPDAQLTPPRIRPQPRSEVLFLDDEQR